MATVTVAPPFAGATTINASNDWVLPFQNGGVVNRWVIHLVNDNTLSATVTIKAKLAGHGLTAVAIPYTKLYLNGAVGDGTQVSTAITDTSLIEVDGTGMDVVVSVAWVSGSASLYVYPVVG